MSTVYVGDVKCRPILGVFYFNLYFFLSKLKASTDMLTTLTGQIEIEVKKTPNIGRSFT